MSPLIKSAIKSKSQRSSMRNLSLNNSHVKNSTPIVKRMSSPTQLVKEILAVTHYSPRIRSHLKQKSNVGESVNKRSQSRSALKSPSLKVRHPMKESKAAKAFRKQFGFDKPTERYRLAKVPT